MRINLAFILIITAFLQLSFAASAQKVTLSEKAVRLEQVFKKTRLQTGYNIIWNQSTLENTSPVSITLKNVELKEAIKKCLEGQSLTFTIKNKTVIIQPEKTTVKEDQDKGFLWIQIKGKVTDEKGLPMYGVTVKNKSTGKAVITDADGNYVILAESNDVLQFSYIGYKPQEVLVGDKKNISIILLEESDQLKEVVVTALGISKDNRKIGYAVTNVSGSLLNQAKEPNVANSLTGRVAGLNVSGVSGGPGASARILIRGITNFTSATGPLFVIDGVPMDNTQKGSPGVYGGQDMGDGISSINPDDIENIVVLKGSTASALYGTRAANGVIQITTKSGKGQNGFGVEYSGNFSLNSIIDNTDYQKAYGQGLNGRRPGNVGDLTAMSVDSWGEILDGAPTISYDGKMHPYAAVNKQLEKFYRTAPVFNNTIALLGGGDRGNFRLSLSQLNNQSVIPSSGLKRYTGNLNLNHNILEKLKLTFMANYIDEVTKLRPNLSDMSRNPNFTMLLLPANIDPRYLKPGYDPVTGYEYAMNSNGYMPNPWFVTDKIIADTKRKRLISSTALKYNFTQELYLQSRLGYDYIVDNTLKIEPTGIAYQRQGQLEESSKAITTELNLDLLMGYSKKIQKDLTMDAALGANIRKFNYELIGISGSQWKIPFLYTPSNLTYSTPLYPSPRRLQTNSLYYTIDFAYKNYLTLSTTGRNDVFSTSLKGNRSIFTPSVSSSFIFSNLADIPHLSLGKLRLAYAETSGEAEPFKNERYYTLQDGTINGKPYANMSDEIIPQSLKPYRLREYEIGLELKAFENRLGFDISYFYRRTKGELVRKNISVASGYDYSYEPLGATQNKGIELVLNGMPLSARNFKWNVSFNFTSVANKLLSIDGTNNPTPIRKNGEGQYRPSVGPYSNGTYIAGVVGLPLAQIMAYDYKYDDKGNIIIGVNGIPLRGDIRPAGSGLPKYYGGLNNEFIYKNFNLSFLIDYRFGNKVLSATDYFSIYYGLNKSTLAGRETGIIANGVTESGATNKVLVSAQEYYKGLVTNVSTITVFDGSFIKFRQVTLGYSLPGSLLRKMPFQSVTFGMTSRNLFTLMKHTKNFDPEDSFSSLAGNAGLEGGGIPQTRNYGFSLNVKFKK